MRHQIARRPAGALAGDRPGHYRLYRRPYRTAGADAAGACREVSGIYTGDVPIRNGYDTPETLGADRLAAAVGAALVAEGRDALVVDFGTAITVDYVSGDGTYRGGAISPGMGMRFQALHRYTARLPLCRETAEERLYGTTTTSCIEQGVMNGIAFEIEGYIARFRRENADICIIFTGGAAKNFAKRIKNAIFADCELVFLGLNRILEFNAEC